MKLLSIFMILFSLLTVNCGSKKEDKTAENLLLLKLIAPEAFDKLFGLNQDTCTPSPDPKVSLFHCTSERDKWASVPVNVQSSKMQEKFKDSRPTDVSSTSLPTSVNLWTGAQNSGKKYFPVVGDQGAYGTCVSWAVGYAMKSYLEAIDQKREPGATKAHQFSPKYHFWSIPNNQKGKSCGGTGFESAMEVIIKNGIPDLNTVPYTDLGTCDYNTAINSANWTSWSNTAANFKIENYRSISPKKAGRNDIKENIANNRPVVIGAKLGDNFMKLGKNSGTLKGPETYDYNGQHAYHAMIIAGYDDNKDGGSYLVLNSWGTGWGNDGLFWVTYDFFESEFGFAAFVAKNKSNAVVPDNQDKDKAQEGADLMSVDIKFYASLENKANEYELAYKVNNIGATNITVSDGSTKFMRVALVYYKATDANDLGVLYYDELTQGGLTSSQVCTPATNTTLGAKYCKWSIDFPTGKGLSRTYTSDVKTSGTVPITIPSKLDGDYYLLLIADSEDDIAEVDEANNYAWSTAEPITFSGGQVASNSKAQIITGGAATASVRFSRVAGELPKAVKNIRDIHFNTYTPEEIRYALKLDSEVRTDLNTRGLLPQVRNTGSSRIIKPPVGL
jgi:hypothetical protein